MTWIAWIFGALVLAVIVKCALRGKTPKGLLPGYDPVIQDKAENPDSDEWWNHSQRMP